MLIAVCNAFPEINLGFPNSTIASCVFWKLKLPAWRAVSIHMNRSCWYSPVRIGNAKGKRLIMEFFAGTTLFIFCCPLIPRCELLQHELREFLWISSFIAGRQLSECGSFRRVMTRRGPVFELVLGDKGILILDSSLFASCQEARPEDGLRIVCHVVTFANGCRSCGAPVVSFLQLLSGSNCCLICVVKDPFESLTVRKSAVFVLVHGKEDLSAGLLNRVNCACGVEGEALDGTLLADKTFKFSPIEAVVLIGIRAQELGSPLVVG